MQGTVRYARLFRLKIARPARLAVSINTLEGSGARRERRRRWWGGGEAVAAAGPSAA